MEPSSVVFIWVAAVFLICMVAWVVITINRMTDKQEATWKQQQLDIDYEQTVQKRNDESQKRSDDWDDARGSYHRSEIFTSDNGYLNILKEEEQGLTEVASEFTYGDKVLVTSEKYPQYSGLIGTLREISVDGFEYKKFLYDDEFLDIESKTYGIDIDVLRSYTAFRPKRDSGVILRMKLYIIFDKTIELGWTGDDNKPLIHTLYVNVNDIELV